jgi:hypothetical protein
MLRWLGLLGAVLAAAGAGLVAGYLRWGRAPLTSPPPPARASAAAAEGAATQREKDALEQRLQQVLKEQERLARENELLRQQRNTEQLVGGGTAKPLPELPPK